MSRKRRLEIYPAREKRPRLETRVLYLGMAEDIINPLRLEPNLTTLFVIDAGEEFMTWEESKGEIKETLILGSDKYSFDRYSILASREAENGTFVRRSGVKKRAALDASAISINYLAGPATIISEEDSAKGPWRLKFLYSGLARELI